MAASDEPPPDAGLHEETQTTPPTGDDTIDNLPADQAADAVFAPLQQDEVASKVLDAKMCYKRLLSLNGEMCYILITDLKRGAWQVSICHNKSPPIDFLCEWLAKYGSTAPNQMVHFDNGKELGGCIEICDLFSEAGCIVEKTALALSSEIEKVERSHRTIANAVCTVLFTAGLPLKFWPYALRHFVFLHNTLPTGDREIPPVTICTGKHPNLSLLHIFGCHIYALPTED